MFTGFVTANLPAPVQAMQILLLDYCRSLNWPVVNCKGYHTENELDSGVVVTIEPLLFPHWPKNEYAMIGATTSAGSWKADRIFVGSTWKETELCLDRVKMKRKGGHGKQEFRELLRATMAHLWDVPDIISGLREKKHSPDTTKLLLFRIAQEKLITWSPVGQIFRSCKQPYDSFQLQVACTKRIQTVSQHLQLERQVRLRKLLPISADYRHVNFVKEY